MSTFLFYKIYTNQPLTTIYKKAGKNNVQSNFFKNRFLCRRGKVDGQDWSRSTRKRKL